MTLVPEENLGIFIVHHHEGTNLRKKIVSTIMEYYGKGSNASPNSVRMKTDLSIFEGTYRWMTYCHSCLDARKPRDNKLTVNDDNTLSGFGRKIYQVESLLFKSYDGQRTMGFLKNEEGEIEYMSLGNINTFEKVNYKANSETKV